MIELTKEVCSDPAINTTNFAASDYDIVGPAVYLIKLLVRQYGFPCLRGVFINHNWIVPEDLRTANQVHFLHNYCVLCDSYFHTGEGYRPIRHL